MADLSWIAGLLVVVAGAFFFIMGMMAMFKMFYVKVPQGTALIVNTMKQVPSVSFTGGMVLPVIHKKELMKISLVTLEIDRRSNQGLICKDNMRADITVAFYLRVNETAEDVLKVAKSVGVDRASDYDAINNLFNAKFSEALKTAGKAFDFVDLFENRVEFRDSIKSVIGDDLNGYVLEDVAIDYLEQTPKAALDPDNILDSEGIKKITELTAEQKVRTNELERDEEKRIKQKDVETREAILALERQEEEAAERQKREIANIKARESAEIAKVNEENRLASEQARIRADQDILVGEENKNREIEVAEQNRLRAVAIEEERVTKARDLEVVEREREVELKRIDADKSVEQEKKIIAEVIRERVEVEKGVAREEEATQDIRVISDAERRRQAKVIGAEADAQEVLVKTVKDAEAKELSAKHYAVEVNTRAAADLEVADKAAQAKKKEAEGAVALGAAPGLAAAQVREANAVVAEKEGRAEAAVIEARGHAEAASIDAVARAEAGGIAAKLKAEAEGLVDKFRAMGDMSADTRAHEEFRMGLEKALEEALAGIDASKEIARENAVVLSEALQKAKIDIVGGGGNFMEGFAKTLTMAPVLEGALAKSPVLQGLVSSVLGKSLAAAPEATQ